jgi:hypothetical protein
LYKLVEKWFIVLLNALSYMHIVDTYTRFEDFKLKTEEIGPSEKFNPSLKYKLSHPARPVA